MPDMPSSVKWIYGVSPWDSAYSESICFWFDILLLSPIRSSSWLRRSYNAVSFSCIRFPPSFHFSLPVFIPYPFLYRVPMFPGRICQKRHAECTFKSGITMGRLLRCQGSCKDLQKSSSHLTHLSDAVLQGSNVTFLNFSGFCVGLKNSLHYIQTGEAKCCHPLRMFLKKYNFVFWQKISLKRLFNHFGAPIS